VSALEEAGVVRLDVRPTLAAGGEPFGQIVAAADTVPVGGILELLAPFEPVPLYQVMRHRGFSHRTAPQPGGDFLVRFTSTGITPDQLLADIAARHPGVAPILARRGFDLCCGGAKPVELAARAHGVELEGLLEELQTVASES